MGGLEMFISWQALVLAVVVVTVTGGVKTIIGMVYKTWRENRWMAKIVMPGIPLLLATLAGAFIPLRPDAVVEYVTEHTSGFGSVLAYGTWGFVAAGVAGAWLFDRFKDFVTHDKD